MIKSHGDVHTYDVIAPFHQGASEVMVTDKKALTIVVGCSAIGSPWGLPPFLSEVAHYVRGRGVPGQMRDLT